MSGRINASHLLSSPGPAVAEYIKWFFLGWSHTLGEEMGIPKSSQAHWKDTRNMEQDRFFCPQVPPGDQNGYGSLKLSMEHHKLVSINTPRTSYFCFWYRIRGRGPNRNKSPSWLGFEPKFHFEAQCSTTDLSCCPIWDLRIPHLVLNSLEQDWLYWESGFACSTKQRRDMAFPQTICVNAASPLRRQCMLSPTAPSSPHLIV